MTGERLVYELLPAVHRIRDAELGFPLRAYLEVVEDELRGLNEDIDDLYDNWFIETCAEWVVPYLGDLLGVHGLQSVPGGVASQRGLVANTIRYRRRKGTPAMLEQLARDVTGWPARVVEYFQLLGTQQHLDHVRPAHGRIVDLRDAAGLELLNSPFDTATRTADVRHIDVRRGRHNIPNVGLHLWRLAAYAVRGGDAREIDAANGRWTFDPAGRDLQLFHPARPETEITLLAEEVDVPGPLRRRSLHAEFTGGPPRLFYQGSLDGENQVDEGADDDPLTPIQRCLPVPEPSDESGTDPVPPFRIRLDDPVPIDRLICCDLSEWHRPEGGPKDIRVAVDPVLGRLTLPIGVEPPRVRVDYAYGAPGDVGAGPYDRRQAQGDAPTIAGRPWPDRVDWQVGVGRDAEPVPGHIVRTIGEALRLWQSRTTVEPGQVGVIAIMDSASYREDLSVVVPPGNRLLLVAASWPSGLATDQRGAQGKLGAFAAIGLRPHLIGTVAVTGPAGPDTANSEFIVDGLSIEGEISIAPGDLTNLTVAHTTVLGSTPNPRLHGLITASGNPQLTVALLRTICSGVHVPDVAGLGMTDTIVNAGGDSQTIAIDARAAHVEIQACTVLGRTLARSLAASNAILRGEVEVGHRQKGCVRFSYLPLSSRTPRRYRCHPVDEVAARSVMPSFTSISPADPGFGQLGRDCPTEIVTGADDEGEMGAYHFLQQHRRMANLASQLDHYLRFGLEAGVFFAT